MAGRSVRRRVELVAVVKAEVLRRLADGSG